MERVAVTLVKGTPWASPITAIPTPLSSRVMVKGEKVIAFPPESTCPLTSTPVRLPRFLKMPSGKSVKAFPSKSRVVRSARPLNRPAGRLVKPLLDKSRVVRPVRLLNIATGSSVKALSANSKVVRLVRVLNIPAGRRPVKPLLFIVRLSRAVSWLNIPAGRVVNWLSFRVRVVSPLRPSRSPGRKVVISLGLSSASRSPAPSTRGVGSLRSREGIAAIWGSVAVSHVTPPPIASTMASRIRGVRLQIFLWMVSWGPSARVKPSYPVLISAVKPVAMSDGTGVRAVISMTVVSAVWAIVNSNAALWVSPFESVAVFPLVKVPPVMERVAVTLVKGTPWGITTTAIPSSISSRVAVRVKGGELKAGLSLTFTACRLVRPLNSPSGRVGKALEPKSRNSRLARPLKSTFPTPLNIPPGRLIKALLLRLRSVRAVRLANRAASSVSKAVFA